MTNYDNLTHNSAAQPKRFSEYVNLFLWVYYLKMKIHYAACVIPLAGIGCAHNIGVFLFEVCKHKGPGPSIGF